MLWLFFIVLFFLLVFFLSRLTLLLKQFFGERGAGRGNASCTFIAVTPITENPTRGHRNHKWLHRLQKIPIHAHRVFIYRNSSNQAAGDCQFFLPSFRQIRSCEYFQGSTNFHAGRNKKKSQNSSAQLLRKKLGIIRWMLELDIAFLRINIIKTMVELDIAFLRINNIKWML